jgi:hypothetical protein
MEIGPSISSRRSEHTVTEQDRGERRWPWIYKGCDLSLSPAPEANAKLAGSLTDGSKAEFGSSGFASHASDTRTRPPILEEARRVDIDF